jgi:hypothetical protein
MAQCYTSYEKSHCLPKPSTLIPLSGTLRCMHQLVRTIKMHDQHLNTPPSEIAVLPSESGFSVTISFLLAKLLPLDHSRCFVTGLHQIVYHTQVMWGTLVMWRTHLAVNKISVGGLTANEYALDWVPLCLIVVPIHSDNRRLCRG